MDADGRSYILVIIFFIASAYCALTETAIASVSRNKIKIAAERGDSRAKKVMYVLDHFDDAITTLLVCTNIAHIAAASVITVYVTRKWGISVITLSTIITTIAMFFIGEMLPKSIGKKASTPVCIHTCGLLVFLMHILWPAAKFLGGIGKLVLKIIGEGSEVSVTEDELYDIIEDMAEEGDLDEEQSELISSALEFADVNVTSILTPRVDLAGIDINSSDEDALAFIKEQTHSRIVVFDQTMDNIVGVLQIRKYLKKYLSEQKIPSIRELMDDVYFVHQSLQIDELFENMTKNRLNMAVILDAYGGTLGIVTIEDILEEIVGEIWDEDDVIKEPVVQLTEGLYLVNGDETVSDTLDFIGYEDADAEEEERFTNLLVADWVYEQLDITPRRGAFFMYDNLKVAVNEMDHNRIRKVTVTVMPKDKEEVDA